MTVFFESKYALYVKPANILMDNTAHTTNPVPFILVNADPKYTLAENGCLADLVPTMIELMGMEQPKEMTGKSLLRLK